jgi:hypothetical protein
MILLRRVVDAIKASFQVFLVNERQLLLNEDGSTAHTYLWDLLGKTSVVCWLEYKREDGTEQFAPLTILRYLDVERSHGIYVAPFTVTVDKESVTFAITLWPYRTATLSLGWSPVNVLD